MVANKWVLLAGGILSGLAVVFGAFAAHSLKTVLDPKALGWIETGVTYQSTHALALLVCGLLPYSNGIKRTVNLFLSGIVLFSGSLYLMALSGNTLVGIVTPVGGVLLIAAWLSFCHSVMKLSPN